MEGPIPVREPAPLSPTPPATSRTDPAAALGGARDGHPPRRPTDPRRVLRAARAGAHRRHGQAGQRGPDDPHQPHRAAPSAGPSTRSTPSGAAWWASRRCRTCASIPEPVDLAVIVTPPPGVPALIEECGQAGIGAVIVISAGFKEVGPEGAEIERQVVEAARRYGIRRHRAQLPGRDEPGHGAQRDVRGGHGAARPGRVREPERRARDRGPGLGAAREGRASAPSCRWGPWRTWAGATSSTTWATTATPTRS